MDIWSADKLTLFLIFFVPGFISIKIYDLLVPGESRDFARAWFDALAYSALNFAALSWLIILIHLDDFPKRHLGWYLFLLLLILIAAPAIWPWVYLRLSSWHPVAKYLVHPIRKPWDYVFGKRETYWVIVHLQDGRRIGGRFDTQSFASSSPAEEQIYLEQVWALDDSGRFLHAIDRSRGTITIGNQILAVEFFDVQ